MQPIALCFHDPLGIRIYPETQVLPLMPGVCSLTYEQCHITALLADGREVKYDPTLHGHLLPPYQYPQWWTDEPGCPYLTELSKLPWAPYDFGELQARWAQGVQKESNISRHRGTVGKREDFLLTYVSSSGPYESEYGVSWRHEFIDKKDKFIWWTGTRLDIIPTEQRNIRATVKAHDTYGGEEITVLTRCSALKGERKLTIPNEEILHDPE